MKPLSSRLQPLNSMEAISFEYSDGLFACYAFIDDFLPYLTSTWYVVEQVRLDDQATTN